jgi:hypothetical protein
MSVQFKISAIENNFNQLFNLTKEELKSKGAVKMIVDEKPGYPCRASLEDAEIGEEIILFPFQHHKTDSPYQSSGPIFVRRNAKNPNLDVNEIPKMLLHRLLSLRVYDNTGMMIDAKTTEGEKLKNEIEVIFNNNSAHYIQIHNSSPGCYNCQVNRTE